MTAPNTLTATELAQRLDAGTVTAEQIVRAHLDRIDRRDADVLAWAHLARDAALERAKVLDRGPRQGLLHGIPMGVKDIIDSFDQPTGYGSPAYRTHRPLADAATVAMALASKDTQAGRATRVRPSGSPPALTEREQQVLDGMSRGKSNAEIGRELYLSEDTVKTHARRLFRKLAAADRAQAVALGFRWGFLR